jgi:FkbM family methyltransferase
MILRSLNALNYAPWWRTTVATWGGRFQPPSADRLAYLWLHKLGIMGADRALLEAQVQPGMVVADVGANIGLFTYLLARRVGERGLVYAFEPNPALFASLETNCRTNGLANVRLHNIALGAQDDTLTLRRARFNSGDSRLSRATSPEARDGVSVPVRPIDALLDGRPLDFLKIDVQGWELEVFRGMRGQLAGSRPLKICFEFWPAGLRSAGTDPAELLAFLGEHGFHLYRTENHALTPLPDTKSLEGSLKGTTWVNLMAIR